MRGLQLRAPGIPIAETELILHPNHSVYHLGVSPEQLATDIWIVGDPERVPLISRHLDRLDFSLHNREFVLHTGELGGKRLTIVSSGIGVDNIDILINELDAAVNVDLEKRQVKEKLTSLRFLRLGTSGAIQPEISVGTVVASKFAFALDGVPLSYEMEFNQDEIDLMDALQRAGRLENGLYTAQGSDDLLQRYAIHQRQGITFTANGFYGPQGRSVRLKSKFEDLHWAQSFKFNDLSITNIEMECAGLYAMSSLLGHEALTCCVILANRATKEFSKNTSKMAESLIESALQVF
jgi:uridine phosphorylase